MPTPNVYPEESPIGERADRRETWRDAGLEAFAAARVRCAELGGRIEANANGATFLWHGWREVPGGSVPRLVGALVAGATTARLMDEWEA